MRQQEPKFVDGLFFSQPRQNAPQFILGNISISKAKFLTWLDSQQPNDKDYVNIDIKMSKQGKVYCTLNDWKPVPRANGF